MINLSVEMTYKELVETLQGLNPDAVIRAGVHGVSIKSSLPVKKLILPNGFYKFKGNCITNKGNSMIYMSINIELAKELMPNKKKKTNLINRFKQKILSLQDKER